MTSRTLSRRRDFAVSSGPMLSEFTLARGGTRVAELTEDGGTNLRRTTDLAGTLTEYSDTMGSRDSATHSLAISPNGRRVAAWVWHVWQQTTNIYDAGVLKRTVKGFPRAQLSDTRLLVQEYNDDFIRPVLVATKVYDDTGRLVATSTLPGLGDPTLVVTPTRVYFGGSIYDVTTGAKVWTSAYPNATSATIAGPRVLPSIVTASSPRRIEFTRGCGGSAPSRGP